MMPIISEGAIQRITDMHYQVAKRKLPALSA